MPDFSFVERPDSIIARLTAVDRIAIDTEFFREKTYFAELCLVQVAISDHIFCVDPLTPYDKQAFWETLMAKYWVLHSGRQDIEVIFQSATLMPAGIFDTQIAAGLLGMPPQLGYAALVNELFDIDIAKSHTRADWSQRPLPDELLRYAVEDVEYLLPAYELLAERLDKKGRLRWAEEDSASILDPSLYDTDPDQAILRLKGAVKLRGRSRAAAARLASWRESEALRKNLPRQWIVRDSTLIEIAGKLPTRLEELAEIDGLAPGTLRRSGRKILDMLTASAADANVFRLQRRVSVSLIGGQQLARQRVAPKVVRKGLAVLTQLLEFLTALRDQPVFLLVVRFRHAVTAPASDFLPKTRPDRRSTRHPAARSLRRFANP